MMEQEPKIFNKQLGIDDVIVRQETDLTKLEWWRDELYIQMSGISAGVSDPSTLPTKTFVYFRYAKNLYHIVKSRISDLRCAQRKEFCVQFVESAKRLLKEEDYRRICEDAVLSVESYDEDVDADGGSFNTWE